MNKYLTLWTTIAFIAFGSSGCSFFKATPKNYVIIVAGQSQAIGRPIIETLQEKYPDVYNHKFKTKVWVDNLIESGGRDSTSHFSVPNPYKSEWDLLQIKPLDRQFLQSDVGSHGLEPFLAYEFEKRHPNDTLYIIKFAYGGIPLAHDNVHDLDWNPNQADQYRRMYWAFTNYVLPEAFASLKASGQTFIPLGLVWAQGETDGSASNPEWTHVAGNDHVYLDNLTELFSAMQKKVPEVKSFKKYVLQSVSGFDTNGSPSHPDPEPSVKSPYVKQYVVPDQIQFCKKRANNAELIPTDNLPIIGTTYNANPHFSTDAYYLLSQTLLSKML